jgi:deoxyribonuclease-4
VRIGAHESTAGGLYQALLRGEADGCEAVQIFTGFNTRWAPRPLSDEEASTFLSTAAGLGWPVLSHGCYLVNLASPDPALWRRSVGALVQELRRCETLAIPHVVLHPGSHVGAGEQPGLTRVARGLGEVLRRTRGFRAGLLLENTAGQGSTLGGSFAQLARLLELAADAGRLGVCIDTCHAFAAGYDLGTAEGYAAAVAELDRTVGLARVRAFHLNDSRQPLGSRRDRHASIGEGRIGSEAFGRLVNDVRFRDLPAVVETPAEADGRPSFARNIRTLKRLRTGGAIDRRDAGAPRTPAPPSPRSSTRRER